VVPIEDPVAGSPREAALRAARLQAARVWTLVKIKKSVKDWLLIKERDAYTSKNGATFPPGSVLSG